jgi:hypothetical protein
MHAHVRLKRMIGLYPWGMHLRNKSVHGRQVSGIIEELLRLFPPDCGVEIIAPEVPPSVGQFNWGRYINIPMVDPFYDEPPCEYLPIANSWRPGPHRRMCYQFYGTSDWRHQNFRKAEAIQLFESFPTIDKVKLGIPLTIQQSAEVMRHSDFFVGVDSGMLHLARCVGVPAFANPNRVPMPWFHQWHKEGSPSYTIFRSLPELHAHLRERLPWVLPGV